MMRTGVVGARAKALAAAGCLALAACGTSVEERALSGGGLGAAAGVAVGAVTGLTLLEGALIGAGLGAATGALTDPGQINLGPPLWRGQATARPTSSPPATAIHDPLVRDIQIALNARGFDAGPADGLPGPRTRTAISAYQRSHALPIDGEPTPQLLAHLQRHATR